MTLTQQSILEFGLPETAALLTKGFEGYTVPLTFSLATLLHSIRVDGVDGNASQVALRDGEPVGVALIARRGWRCRLAAMAIVPTARGQGVGRAFLADLIAAAKTRGERAMLLEVIADNKPAVQLYERCGFSTVRRLVSLQRPASKDDQIATPTESLVEVDIAAVAELVTSYGLPELPWQISGASLIHSGPPGRAYRLQEAYVVFSDPAAEQIGIRSLIVQPEWRGQGQATRLLQALFTAHPGKTWQVPALFPEEMTGVFTKAGFQRQALSQFQMTLPLQ